MLKNLKLKEIVITSLLAIALLFFVVIGVFQIYEEVSINGDDERIVLGVSNATNSPFGSKNKNNQLNLFYTFLPTLAVPYRTKFLVYENLLYPDQLHNNVRTLYLLTQISLSLF